MTVQDVNPLVVFGGFAASVALVLALVISSITVYRYSRQRQQRAPTATAALLTGRKRAAEHQDRIIVASEANQLRAAAEGDIVRLTMTEDVRPASNYNAVRDPLKTDKLNV